MYVSSQAVAIIQRSSPNTTYSTPYMPRVTCIELFELLLVVLAKNSIEATLVFPALSVLQMTASLAVPIELPERKLYWDWGFQMNYELPFNVTQFYNAPIWPREFDDRKRPHIEKRETFWNEADYKYQHGNIRVKKHSGDFTAGELYHSFENLLVRYGFDETCLLRSVCELAHHPFSNENQNILTEIFTFILTPSIHEAFSPSEIFYRQAYEESERRGFLHSNCAELYYDCKQDLLTLLTNVLTNFKRGDNNIS